MKFFTSLALVLLYLVCGFLSLIIYIVGEDYQFILMTKNIAMTYHFIACKVYTEGLFIHYYNSHDERVLLMCLPELALTQIDSS